MMTYFAASAKRRVSADVHSPVLSPPPIERPTRSKGGKPPLEVIQQNTENLMTSEGIVQGTLCDDVSFIIITFLDKLACYSPIFYTTLCLQTNALHDQKNLSNLECLVFCWNKGPPSLNVSLKCEIRGVSTGQKSDGPAQNSWFGTFNEY